MLCPVIEPLYFLDSGLPLPFCRTWAGSQCNVDIVFQKLYAVALMLHRMAFCLSSKVVRLHLDYITTKVYLCNQGVEYLFFPDLPVIWLTNPV